MTATRTKTRRLVPITAAAIAAAAVIGAGAFFLPNVLDRSGGSSAAVPSGPAMIPAFAPADADTFVLAPYSADWWAKIAAMASPESGILQSDPVPAGFRLDRIGYSRSPDHVKRDVSMTGPLRLFYLEAPTAEEATRIGEWLQTAPGNDRRRVTVSDRVIIITPTWVSSYEAPETPITAVPGYRTDETPGKGTYWMNVDQETASIAGGADEATKTAATALVRNGMGFAQGTTWLGTSDAGDSWAGRFAAGGVKPENINFDTVRKDVAATEKVLTASKEGNVSYKVLASSASQVLTTTRITAEGQSGNLGTGDLVDFPKVTAPVVSATTEVTDWNAALSGRYGTKENVATRNISANESEMVVSFGFAAK